MTILNRIITWWNCVLQHNFQNPKLEGTVKALPQMIDQLRAEGYEFVTVVALLSSN
ncbi:hypothetical protein KEH51_11080 [[Brevibacterium] frigoritolerans]|uniref:NodB homology domain-containing protein n=1 Tax=Peribacillus frigoritolerans TaxID=450367 RepID=A0A941J6N6_9BACI|nr:hypothetical protein [Peribacillus frigoritolerans]